ncbi:MAG: hypothetical protein QG658_23 [Patescibacteria group bacterium]|jgi:UPF0755 protein|nr:hypothetical protein [Patescibacteria group bacterium]
MPPKKSGQNLGSSHAIHTVKRQPAHRKIAKSLVIAISAGVLVIIITLGWAIYAINTPAGTGKPQLITIQEGSSIDSIATQLAQAKVISNDQLFKLYARLGPARGQLRPGPYMLSPGMTMVEIVDYLASGKIAARQVTIAEGKTIKQIAAVLEEDTDFKGQGFESVAKSQPEAQQLLRELNSPAGNTNPEGVYFPNTYEVLKTQDVSALAQKMLAGFRSEALLYLVNPQPEEGKEVHPYVAQLTPYQRLIVASMVEKEAAKSDDRAKIAGVFYNRLSQGMRLESDPTINYVTGKVVPSAADLTINSPYNTYRTRGLPPTPICNPSLDSIKATIYATPNDFLFFIGKDRKVYFAETYAEHQANIEKYLK